MCHYGLDPVLDKLDFKAFFPALIDHVIFIQNNHEFLNILRSQLKILKITMRFVVCQELHFSNLTIYCFLPGSMKNVEQMIIGSPNGHSPTFKKFIKDIADSKTKYVSLGWLSDCFI